MAQVRADVTRARTWLATHRTAVGWFLIGLLAGAILYAAAVRTPWGQRSLAADTCDCDGRFEFAAIPEVALIRGIPQTVQLGFYQLDVGNPWPAGDQTRASGWTAKRATQLIDPATGEAPPGVSYVSGTGELRYDGQWSGAVTVHLTGGGAQSNAFRIRALTPTVVYGMNASAINTQKGWNAKVCDAATVTFKACRTQFSGGASDAAPTVLHITPGTYAQQDFYLGARLYLYVLGDPANRPVLVGDNMGGQGSIRHYFANLDLRNTNVTVGTPPAGQDAVATFRNIVQCCETTNQNGIVNSNGSTKDNRWEIYVHNFEGVGMGGTGNTTHQFYIEGRPNSRFDLNNVLIRGTRISSAIKNTMQELNVRHSKLCTTESCAAGTPGGLYMHTPIDTPAFTDVVVYANHFVAWREAKKPLPALLFLRMRQNTYGSDIPAYPNVSWDPPVSTQYGRSPGGTWSRAPATYVADAFWADVTAKPLDDPANPYLFKHYVANNTFELVPGSASITLVRDDGTGPGTDEYQFGPQKRVWTNVNSVERSTTFITGNRYVGFPADYVPAYRTDISQYVRSVQEPRCEDQPVTPCTKWPRTEPEDFPRIIEVPGALPPWFKI